MTTIKSVRPPHSRDPGADAPTRSPHRWSIADWLVCLVLAAAAVGVFAKSVKGGFVYDDQNQILKNGLIQTPGLEWRALSSDVWAYKAASTAKDAPRPPSQSNYFRPVFVAQLILQHRLFGIDDPRPWHVSNMLAHALVSVLAYVALRRLGEGLPLVLAVPAALVFAVHPVHVESVTWIAGSPDLLLGAALIPSLLIGHRLGQGGPGSLGPNPRWVRLVLIAALATLAVVCVGSKEVGVMVAPLAMLAAFESARRVDGATFLRSVRRSLLVSLPAWLVVGAFLLARSQVIDQPRTISTGTDTPQMLASIPRVGLFYLRQCFWPFESLFVAPGQGPGGVGAGHPLRPVRPEFWTGAAVWSFWVPLALSIVAGVIALAGAVRSASARLGIAIFVLTLAPALYTRAFPPEHMVRDRYLYLPLLGMLMFLCGAAAGLVRARDSRWPQRTYIAAGLAMSLLIASPFLAIKTWAYSSAWLSEEALWTNASRQDPTASQPLTELARLLSASERRPTHADVTRAIEMYSRAIGLSPAVMNFSGRARAYLKLGDMDAAAGPGSLAAARDSYARAESDARAAASALGVLGPSGIRTSKPGPERDNASVEALDNLAVALERQGRLVDLGSPSGIDDRSAAGVYRLSRSLHPFAAARITAKLAVVLYRAGDKAGARRELESVLSQARTEADPGASLVLQRLAMLLIEGPPPEKPDEARALELLREFLAMTNTAVHKKDADVALARGEVERLLRTAGLLK